MTRAKAARADLIEIWLFSGREWGAERADAYLAEIEDAIQLLATFPESGSPSVHLGRSYRRTRVGSHIVIYRADPSGIRIIRVLHQRMDVNRHLW